MHRRRIDLFILRQSLSAATQLQAEVPVNTASAPKHEALAQTP
jgi:hypothetical protein